MPLSKTGHVVTLARRGMSTGSRVRRHADGPVQPTPLATVGDRGFLSNHPIVWSLML
jgi:hypothetical protein